MFWHRHRPAARLSTSAGSSKMPWGRIPAANRSHRSCIMAASMPIMAAFSPSDRAGRYRNGMKPYSAESTMARTLLPSSASTLKLPSSCTMPELSIMSLK